MLEGIIEQKQAFILVRISFVSKFKKCAIKYKN